MKHAVRFFYFVLFLFKINNLVERLYFIINNNYQIINIFKIFKTNKNYIFIKTLTPLNP